MNTLMQMQNIYINKYGKQNLKQKVILQNFINNVHCFKCILYGQCFVNEHRHVTDKSFPSV